jgi:hypothetical protein
MACRLIKEHYNEDPTNDAFFKEIYEKNVDEAFDQIDTDELVVLNRALLDSQINSFIRASSPNNSPNNPLNNSTNNSTNKSPTSFIMNGAVDRVKEDVESIYTSTLSIKTAPQAFNGVILPYENNIIFAGSYIIVLIDEIKHTLKLRNSFDIGGRKYLEYETIEKITLSIQETIKICIQNVCGKTCHKEFALYVGDIIDNVLLIAGSETYRVGDIIQINDELHHISFATTTTTEDITQRHITVDGDITHISVGDRVINVSENPVFTFYS